MKKQASTESESESSGDVKHESGKAWSHWEHCDAPICADEGAYDCNPDWKNEVIWYPGEAVCERKPYTEWQRRQAQINRWFKQGIFKHAGNYFTVTKLLKGDVVTPGKVGFDPDAYVDL